MHIGQIGQVTIERELYINCGNIGLSFLTQVRYWCVNVPVVLPAAYTLYVNVQLFGFEINRC